MGDCILKELKDYIRDYKNAKNADEKDFLLQDLIATEIVRETNNIGEVDDIYYLRFTDKALQKTYKGILGKFYWVDRKDLDEYVLKAVYDLFNHDKIDLKRDSLEVLNWFRKSLLGRVKNQVTKENEKTKKNSPEHKEFYDDDGEKHYSSLYDDVAEDRYIQEKNINLFDKFIDSIGGIENILSEIQYEVYCLIQNDHMTQEDIALILDCSQENISKHIKALTKRIKKEYLNFRTYRALRNSTNTYHKIQTFLHNYNNIIEFDHNDQFNYFGFIIKFLQENYQQGEQNINFNIQMNSVQSPLTVLDVLIDHLRPNEQKLFKKVIEELIYYENGLILTQPEKDKVRNTVLRAFITYIKEIKQNIKDTNATIINNYDKERYNEFIDLIV